jgi:hypothetical protein
VQKGNIVEQDMRSKFEKWWKVAVISDVTGEVDYALWPNIDKEDAYSIWSYAWNFALQSQSEKAAQE